MVGPCSSPTRQRNGSGAPNARSAPCLIASILRSPIGIDFGNKPSNVGSEGPGTLNISIADASFFENAGPGATTATVTRSDSAGDLTLVLSSSDTSEATVSAFVFIPNGKTSVTFPIAAVDDTLLDGTQVVTIIASASGYSNGSDTVNVLDNESIRLPPVAVDDRVTVVTNAPSTIAVLSNDSDPTKRESRLALLARLRDAVHGVADFSKIEG